MQRQNAGRGQNTYPKTKKPDNVRLLFAFMGILSRKKGWTMLPVMMTGESEHPTLRDTTAE